MTTTDRISILLVICCIVAHLKGMDGKPKQKTVIIQSNQPVTLNLGQKTNAEFNNKNTAESSSQSTSQAIASAHTTVTTIVQTLQQTIAAMPQEIQAWCKRHPWHIAFGSTLTTYAILSAVLLEGNYYLNKEDTWGRWKHHLSIEELNTYALDDHKKQELAHNLITTILQRYFNNTAPTNHLEPLIIFMRAMDHEAQIMHRYLLIASTIHKAKLTSLFPTNETKLQHAQDYRQRLQFIRQLFIAKMATYNLNQLLHPTPSSTKVIEL